MTSRVTASACIGLYKIHGEVPFAEIHIVSYHFRVSSAVDRVAGPAVPSILFPVYMQIVHISFAIPETCCKGCIRKTEQVSLMAGKTESVFVLSIWYIEIRLEPFQQQTVILRAVWIVTGSACSLFYRAMKCCLVLLYYPGVTAETEVFPRPICRL